MRNNSPGSYAGRFRNPAPATPAPMPTYEQPEPDESRITRGTIRGHNTEVIVGAPRLSEGERRSDHEAAVTAVRAFMDALNMDEGMHTAETPERVVKAWKHRLAGYDEDPERHLDKRFPVEGDPGIVIVTGIEFASTCAHHLLPITGKATVAYRPDPLQGDVVGLSKLSRVFEGYAHRLQVQEKLGQQTADALVHALAPLGAAVIITAEHGCMTIRGVQQRGTVTTTISTGGDWSPGHADLEWVLAEHRR